VLKPRIDINCDLGESYGAFKLGNDAQIMPHITSANIACGFHSGDPMTMAQTVNLAKKYKVAVGAHPGYPDLMGFGRREIQLASAEVENYIVYQVSALQGFAKTIGLKLQHVKPHGALYNKAAQDRELAKAVIRGVKELDSHLIVFAPPGSELANVASDSGLKVALEFFADRSYNSDGSLVSRAQSKAIVEQPNKVVKRTIRAVCEGAIVAVDGKVVNLGTVHTVCVHGDTPTAVKLAEALRRGLTEAGIEVKPVGSFI
jgi:UPF0271 protein